MRKERGLELAAEPSVVYIHSVKLIIISEPVWPSGKALIRLVSGRTSVRYRFGSPFSSKNVVVCGHCLVTLSITSYWNIKMALIAAHLNAEVILVVTV